jgi:hypothetical protein
MLEAPLVLAGVGLRDLAPVAGGVPLEEIQRGVAPLVEGFEG